MMSRRPVSVNKPLSVHGLLSGSVPRIELHLASTNRDTWTRIVFAAPFQLCMGFITAVAFILNQLLANANTWSDPQNARLPNTQKSRPLDEYWWDNERTANRDDAAGLANSCSVADVAAVVIVSASWGPNLLMILPRRGIASVSRRGPVVKNLRLHLNCSESHNTLSCINPYTKTNKLYIQTQRCPRGQEKGIR